jgi:hypothetical protein
MLIYFFDIDGVIYKEFVPPGQTVNAKFYCDFLRLKRPEKLRMNNWVLRHDSAPAHIALSV